MMCVEGQENQTWPLKGWMEAEMPTEDLGEQAE